MDTTSNPQGDRSGAGSAIEGGLDFERIGEPNDESEEEPEEERVCDFLKALAGETDGVDLSHSIVTASEASVTGFDWIGLLSVKSGGRSSPTTVDDLASETVAV
jgi:hypothetical protein